jgi:hypothetical protein
MKTYVFIGPTISESEARQWLDAVYLPPVAQGDILSVLRYEAEIIGIIDGYYERVPAVWHKEILLALARRVWVIGAASIGALRAAELHSFGMRGVGEVFEWYRDGLIDADDEVAIHHASRELGYKPLSEALVNIRKTLQAAVRDKIIQETTRQTLIEIGLETPFWERSYPALLKMAAQDGLPPGELDRLERFVSKNRIDLKKQDAIQALRHMARLQNGPPPPPATFDLQRTVYLENLADRDLSLNPPGETRLTPESIVNHARLALKDFLALEQRAVNNSALLTFAHLIGLEASPQEVRKELEEIRQHLKLSNQDLLSWMRCQHLTEEELERFVAEKLVLSKVLKLFASPANQDVLRQLRLEDKYERLARSALESEIAFAKDSLVEGLSPEELARFYCAQIKREMPDSLEILAQELGFNEESSLIVELQKFYAWKVSKDEVRNPMGGEGET